MSPTQDGAVGTEGDAVQAGRCRGRKISADKQAPAEEGRVAGEIDVGQGESVVFQVDAACLRHFFALNFNTDIYIYIYIYIYILILMVDYFRAQHLF